MVIEFEDRLAGGSFPDEEFVVVATGVELLLVWRPLKTADLLLMTLKAVDVGLMGSQIAVEDGLVA